MIYPIKNQQSGKLCFDEARGKIYSASRVVREISFPECKTKSTIVPFSHACLALSDSGDLLAVYTPEHHLQVFRTGNWEKPLFDVWWKKACSTDDKCSFLSDDSLIVTVQNNLYRVKIDTNPIVQILYGDPRYEPKQENWHIGGRIKSLSIRNQEYASLCQSYSQGNSVLLYASGPNNDVVQRVVPKHLHLPYGNVLLHPNGGMCLFSHIPGIPMLFYETIDTDLNSPDRKVELSGSSPIFSSNGRYLSFYTLSMTSIQRRCWLVDTRDWSVVKVVDGIFYGPSFSSDNRYWLLPGKKPVIVDLDTCEDVGHDLD